MPDQRKINVFSPEFLQHASARESLCVTATEAAWAGPWTIEQHDAGFAVIREGCDEPEATMVYRETALLLAAIFPVIGRGLLYSLEYQMAETGAGLRTLFGETGIATVGKLRRPHEGVVEPLSVVEHLLRSPRSLAFLLEAAPFESLEHAGAILTRRFSEQQKSET